jgi:RND family efflux transporter MFP subunit
MQPHFNDDQDKKMKWLIPLSSVVLLALMVAWMAGSFDEKVAPGAEQAPVQAFNEADIFEVREQEVEIFEAVPATIAAKQTAVISSRILARIEQVRVRAGEYVRKGQELVVLERTDLKSRVSQAQSQISSIEARLKEAKQALDRAIELNKRGLLAQAPLDSANANFDSLQAQRKSAQQALIEAETALDYASVQAPFDGLIIDRFAEPGNTAQPGMALLSLYNPGSVRVEANVREERAIQLKLGQRLTMHIPSRDIETFAEIEELVPAGNVASRTFLVKSQIQEVDGLLPGMYARLLIPAGTAKRIMIPQAYVAEVGQLNIVWVLPADLAKGAPEKRFVKTGRTHEPGMVEIVSGLTSAERLLKKP